MQTLLLWVFLEQLAVRIFKPTQAACKMEPKNCPGAAKGRKERVCIVKSCLTWEDSSIGECSRRAHIFRNACRPVVVLNLVLEILITGHSR